jgi:hypothetical protein
MVEWNRKAGQNPPRAVAPIEEEEEESTVWKHWFHNFEELVLMAVLCCHSREWNRWTRRWEFSISYRYRKVGQKSGANDVHPACLSSVRISDCVFFSYLLKRKISQYNSSDRKWNAWFVSNINLSSVYNFITCLSIFEILKETRGDAPELYFLCI